MTRKEFSQLPSAEELRKIRAAEVERPIAVGKESVHFVGFSAIIALAERAGVNAAVFASEFSSEEVYTQDIFAQGSEAVVAIKEWLLQSPDAKEAVCDDVYDYLAEEDAPETSDIVFVFGAKTPLRIEKAIELYNKGLGKKLLVSGRGPHYAEDEKESEAQTYARIAVEHGVPQVALVIETQSITVPDNVRASLNVLDEQNVAYQSISLVNSPYTQRRGWAHFKKYTPESVTLRRVNCTTGENFRRGTWYRNPTGIDVVLGEFIKLKVAVSLNTA